MIWDGRNHVVTFIIDGGPRVASVVVDEHLDDGGDAAARSGLIDLVAVPITSQTVS